ncbi:MAG: tetratricopeptide repeat protein [Acidobacteriaceae bacterium]|nr:tetratricopeptide repeat protein [Acidobacteriaceae bacterium]
MRARTTFVLGFFSAFLYAQSDSALADHFRSGQAAAAQLNYDRAIAEFQAVLKIDPTVVQARANLGLMYYSTGEYSKAAKELSQAARTKPDLLPAQLFLGLSDLKLGNAGDAVVALRHAARLDPNNVEAARGLLACYVTLSDYGPAFEQLQFFADCDDEQSLFVAGQAHLDIGRALTKQLALKYRDSAWAHQLAGDLATDRNDAKTAADEYVKARSLNPSVTESKVPVNAAELPAQLEGQRTPEV